MTTKKITFEDFQIEKLSKSHQKTVQGGDNNDSIDPSKGTGKGNG
ncbi:rSAM-modified peptide [Flavobacterium sp.]